MNLPTKENAKLWLWDQWTSGEVVGLRGKVSGDVIFELGKAKKELFKNFNSAKEKLDFLRFAVACEISENPRDEVID